MQGHGSKFGRKKEEAIIALLTQRNVEEAARPIGVSTATLMRWQELPEFRTAFWEARREAFGQSMARLHQMASAAVATLGKVMVEPGTPSSVRVRAAEAIITHGAKAIEIEDIDARVSELEQAAETAKRAGDTR